MYASEGCCKLISALTVVPLPDTPCVRVALQYTQTDGALGGSRFYLGYAGDTPSATTLDGLATDIAAAWKTAFTAVVASDWGLTGIDVLDITGTSGATGLWTGSNKGSLSSGLCPANCAQNIEYVIARRYRGGKPRMFLPPPDASVYQDPGHWTAAQVSAVQDAADSFFEAVEALTEGDMGQLTHLSLSYYFGFKNTPNSSGRIRAVPTYRAAALHDTVVSYNAKSEIGTQKRRRVATTP
uniref:Uncharacterized protein n=1 Tax=uncultured prokaryote TaxID=198431 RepID=A0A0H5Q3K8_9ZZZZ|nr:hypothetical protein [uncultured prokaryote]